MIDKVVIKETRCMAVGVILFSAVMQAIFLVIGQWNVAVLWGNMLGAAVAVFNFLLMGLALQRAVQQKEKDAKQVMAASQLLRLLIVFVAVVLGCVSGVFNTWTVILPLFFPQVIVLLCPLRDKIGQSGEHR